MYVVHDNIGVVAIISPVILTMSSTLQVNKRPSQLDKPATVPHTRVDDELELDNMFSMGKRLGQGSFGIVREAVDISSGKKWAVKAVNKEKVILECQ